MHPRTILLELWNAALEAVSVGPAFEELLPVRASGRTIVVGAGKAAAAMAVAAARVYGPDVHGAVVTRHGHGLRAGESAGNIRIIEAGHPLPDSAGFEAGRAILDCVSHLSERDLVVFLVSGGGSALLEAPLPGIAFPDVRRINAQLLASGAAIGEVNAVRKHLSAIKGGRLAGRAFPARVVTLAISDVPGDDPATIASGPTVADATTQADASDILDTFAIPISPHVRTLLSDPQYESLKPGDPRLVRTQFCMFATQADALAAAASCARHHGLAVLNRGTRIEGEAKTVAQEEAALARRIAPGVILGGGELTVTLSAVGNGGPNREYALALALALEANPRVWALAADTDGIDGSADAAGAIVTPDTLARAASMGLDAHAALARHDSGTFFARLGDALVTGPTRTNVSDFRAMIVLPRT